MRKSYKIDFFKQLESISNKLDNALALNKKLNETIKNLNKTIFELKE